MATIGSLIVNVSAQTGGLVAGLGKGRSAVVGFARDVGLSSTSVGSLTRQFAPFVSAVGAAAGAMKALKIAGEFEQASIAMTTMLKSAKDASTVLGDITQFSATTPFEFPEILQATRKLVGFGFEAKQILPTMRMLGDLAAGVGQPIGEIAEVFGKAKVQGRAFARDIHELTNRGIPIIQALAKQFGVADDKVMKLVEDGKVGFGEIKGALQSLTATGGQFAGLTEAQSKTFLGAFSNLKDQFGLIGRDLGEALIEGLGLKERMKELTTMFELVHQASFTTRASGKQAASNKIGDLSGEIRKALQDRDTRKARDLLKELSQVHTFFPDSQVSGKRDAAVKMFGQRMKEIENAGLSKSGEPGTASFGGLFDAESIKDVLAHMEEIKKSGASMFADLMTPAEQYKKTIEDLSRLLKAGAIDEETFNRGKGKAAADLQAAKDKNNSFGNDSFNEPVRLSAELDAKIKEFQSQSGGPNLSRPGALQAGTVEAFSASQRSQNALNDPMEKVVKSNKEILTEAQKNNRLISDTNSGIKQLNASLGAAEVVA